jgi:hypothetical protein
MPAPTTTTTTTTTVAPPAPVDPTFLGRYTTGLGNTAGETVAFGDGKIFVTNTAGGGSVDVVSIADPAAPALVQRVSTAAYGLPNSVAVSNGLVAVAAEAAVKTDPGKVVFFDTDGTYLCSTRLVRELSLLTESGILTEAEREAARKLAFERSFIKN